MGLYPIESLTVVLHARCIMEKANTQLYFVVSLFYLNKQRSVKRYSTMGERICNKKLAGQVTIVRKTLNLRSSLLMMKRILLNLFASVYAMKGLRLRLHQMVSKPSC